MTKTFRQNTISSMYGWKKQFLMHLGKPYFEADKCLIYNIDCLDALKYLNNDVIDLTITSPPYNIGKAYENVMQLDDYLKWTSEWINEVYRITAPTGAFWLNLGYISIPNKAKAIPLPYLIWDKVPFNLVQEIVWNYGAGVAGKKFLSPRNEKWLWYVKNKDEYIFNLDDIRDKDVKYPNQKKKGQLRCNTIGKNPSDVWQIAKVTSGANRSAEERTPHPAQFPVDLIDRIVRGFSNKEQLILDPFMGSGTTAEICIKEKRNIIGFEIKEEYCKIIADRLSETIDDVHLIGAQKELFQFVECY